MNGYKIKGEGEGVGETEACGLVEALTTQSQEFDLVLKPIF